MKKSDVILAVMIIVALACFGAFKFYPVHNKSQPCWAVITQNNVLVEKINLNAVEQPREITLPGPYHEVVAVEKGRIRFKTADCPDQICVRTGWLEKPGDMAVCLPNKAIINITQH